MKTLRQILTESHKIKWGKIDAPVEKQIRQSAFKWYSEFEPDLPKQGNHHFVSAKDAVRDRVSDEFRKSGFNQHPDFHKIVDHEVSKYAHDDRAESKANDRKHERARTKAMAPKKEKPVKAKPMPPKSRRGIGSY